MSTRALKRETKTGHKHTNSLPRALQSSLGFNSRSLQQPGLLLPQALPMIMISTDRSAIIWFANLSRESIIRGLQLMPENQTIQRPRTRHKTCVCSRRRALVSADAAMT